MTNTIKSAALSLSIALGAIASLPIAAQAEGLYFHLGTGDAFENAQYGERPEYRRYRRDRDDRRYDRREWRCSPDEAAFKARRLGLRNVRVVDVDRRTVTVRGRQWGDRSGIVFGRFGNCPVIDRF